MRALLLSLAVFAALPAVASAQAQNRRRREVVVTYVVAGSLLGGAGAIAGLAGWQLFEADAAADGIEALGHLLFGDLLIVGASMMVTCSLVTWIVGIVRDVERHERAVPSRASALLALSF